MSAVQLEQRESGSDINRMVFLVGAGLFVTTIGQTGSLGQLPFRFLFKNEFHMSATQQATFGAVATMAWYFKPLAGLLVDSVPLFGTKRRNYLILSALISAICWALFAVAPHKYNIYLYLTLTLNAFMVLGSTVIGGLLVDTGKRGGATGRLTSVRYFVDNVGTILIGPLGGWLATKAFGFTAGIGALLLFSLIPAALLFLKHDRVDTGVDAAVWSRAGFQFKTILRSPTMWSAAGLLFLVFVAPGFGVVMNYYQSDVLHFSTKTIGNLQMAAGAGGIIATVLYAKWCRTMQLKHLLFWGILLNALSSLLYLGYNSVHIAPYIDFTNGVLGTLGVLPLFDLCARSTPKGCESFGYSLLMSVYNVAIFVVSLPVGSWLYDKKDSFFFHNFHGLVWLSTITSLIALVLLPILPKDVIRLREGEVISS